MNASPPSPSEAMKLVLEDGTELRGLSFGHAGAVAGEVVFNTAMTGYLETLTDPSYRGQILVCTYPLVGNYGVPPPRPAGSLDRPFESSRIQVQALVVQSYVDAYSHHAARRSLGDWLRAESVPAMTGVDTRTLTRRLRERGTMNGWLFPESLSLSEARASAHRVDMAREVFELVAPSEPILYEGGPIEIVVVDAGVKDNIVRSLLERGASVRRVLTGRPPKIRPIHHPVLVIWGDRDLALGKEMAEPPATLVPNARVVHLPDSTHWVQNDAPEKVNELLVQFIRDRT